MKDFFQSAQRRRIVKHPLSQGRTIDCAIAHNAGESGVYRRNGGTTRTKQGMNGRVGAVDRDT